MTYYGPRRAYRRTNIGPTYADLLTATDENGENRSYMASEKNFMMLQEMESKNLIIPLVGDFAGDKALPRVARYLTEHDTKVTTFYLSNVEQYLFEQNTWKKFYSNMKNLPVEDSGMLIRSVFARQAIDRVFSDKSAAQSLQLLGSFQETLRAYDAGEIRVYEDILHLP